MRDTAVLARHGAGAARALRAARASPISPAPTSSLPLPCGQTMTAPSAVAAMLVALGARAGPARARDRHRLGLRHGAPRPARLPRDDRRALRDARRGGAGRGSRSPASSGIDDRRRRRPRARARRAARFDRILVNGAVAAVPARADLAARARRPARRRACGRRASRGSSGSSAATDGAARRRTLGAPLRLARAHRGARARSRLQPDRETTIRRLLRATDA